MLSYFLLFPLFYGDGVQMGHCKYPERNEFNLFILIASQFGIIMICCNRRIVSVKY